MWLSSIRSDFAVFCLRYKTICVMVISWARYPINAIDLFHCNFIVCICYWIMAKNRHFPFYRQLAINGLQITDFLMLLLQNPSVQLISFWLFFVKRIRTKVTHSVEQEVPIVPTHRLHFFQLNSKAIIPIRKWKEYSFHTSRQMSQVQI